MRDDDRWHTPFKCKTWRCEGKERFRSVEKIEKGELNPENLGPTILKSVEGLKQVPAFICNVMRRKMEMDHTHVTSTDSFRCCC